MHRSRLSGFILDCNTNDLDAAATFWSKALGMPVKGRDGDTYVKLDASARDMDIELQQVAHESRVHLDIETDDVDAEVARLEKLGAKRLSQIKTWWVMEAPTGQRFCVILRKEIATRGGATIWT